MTKRRVGPTRVYLDLSAQGAPSESRDLYVETAAMILRTIDSFAAGWSDGDPIAEYYKDTNSIVYLRGFVTKTVPATPEVMFTLPAGFRPGSSVWFWIGVQELQVDPNGDVWLNVNPTYTEPPGVNLTGISFLAEQ